MPKEHEFAPPQADYERPKPVGAAQAPAPPVVDVRTVVLLGGDEPAVVRIALAESEDGEWTAELQHEYEGLDVIGRGFHVGELLYEVTGRKGRVLTLEVA